MSLTDVFRDDKVHVCARMCKTCIFRPGNLMGLRPGRVEQMVREVTRIDGCIPCHQTTYGQHEAGEAVCRGFFELHATAPLVLARLLERIEWQEPLTSPYDASLDS